MAGLINLAWHGGPSFSLRLGDTEVLVDPAFSRPGDYPPWFDERRANPHAPTVEAFLRVFEPRFIFITHGHFDHFDLETVRRLAAARKVVVAGSAEVTRTCREVLGLDPARLLTLEPDRPVDLGSPGPGSVRVRPRQGPHWFTGEEGTAVAAKLAGRPDRYGAMPCGGPMLGLIFEVPPGPATVYASGDTEAPDLPEGPFDVAVVSCGGELVNPVTKLREPPFIDETTLARQACLRLRAGVLVPVHYDHPVFQTPFDTALLAAELARYPDPPRLVVPPYNRWVELV